MEHYDQLRQEVMHYAQLLVQEGYLGGGAATGGNLSLRSDRDGIVAITPTSRPYGEMAWTDICLVNMEGHKVAGPYEPSVEIGFHLEVYRRRPDVGAVVHTHQTFASVFAVLGLPIPPLFDEVTAFIGDRIEVIPYAFSGSPELVGHVAEKVANRCQCYIMQNHGALSLGPNLPQAYRNAALLEKAARIYYYALSTGREVCLLPEDIQTMLRQVVLYHQDQEKARSGRN